MGSEAVVRVIGQTSPHKDAGDNDICYEVRLVLENIRVALNRLFALKSLII